ncbi:MAG TPA: DUF624 domain-containing protein [Roseiflexaceae bacterium]|nr:DUF624 domain-containing protein [Roseiflexaceae bacterium]
MTAWECLTTTLRLVWRRIGLLLAANVLWIALSLPIVTWPAATAGLFYLISRVVKEELDFEPRDARLSDFWEGVRQYGWRGSLLALIDLLALLIIGIALRFYSQSPTEWLRWLVGPIALIGLAVVGAQLYLYPLLIQRPERPIWELAREAFLIAISYWLYTLSLLITATVVAIAAALLAGPVLLIFFSLLAMFETVALRLVLIHRGEIVPVRLPR